MKKIQNSSTPSPQIRKIPFTILTSKRLKACPFDVSLTLLNIFNPAGTLDPLVVDPFIPSVIFNLS